ncbi:hypothetical protein N665_0026s0035 [Sinapis alba]|nr:hypothetical protein N665_0026s0035 [Sinapis alba]
MTTSIAATSVILTNQRANPLLVLPPRCRTRAHVEPFLSGVTAVERNKRLWSLNINIRAGVR